MTLRPRDKLAIGVVAGVVVVIAFYVLVLTPVRHRAARLDVAIASQQGTLIQDESTYQAGKAAEATVRANSAQWKALERAVPSTSNIPALLRILQHDAKVAKASIQTISLSGGTGAASTTGATGTEAPSPVPISLTFAGNYQELHRLISTLDNLVTVSGQKLHATGPLLNISGVDLSGSGSKLTAQITASIYQLAGASTAAATSTGGTS